MKPRAITALALMAIAHSFCTPAYAESWRFERDKQLHFGISFGFGAAATVGRNYNWREGCAIGALPGLAKEYTDAKGDSGFSTADLAYDIAGSCLGSWLVYKFHKWLD